MFTQLLQLTGLVQKWPTITREEVAKHSTADSLWIVVGDSVYDITSVVDRHPGGKGALLKRGGGVKDCTEDLMFHSRATRREAQKYKIGELSPYDVSITSHHAPESPVFSARCASSVPSISKVVIPSDAEDLPEYSSESAMWDSSGRDYLLSSSDNDIHLVREDNIPHANLVK
jgi:hypothetical protein